LAALVLMLPLLTFMGMIGGLLGGLIVCWSSLNLGPAFFFQRLVEDGSMAQHMMVGLVKAPVFALVIAAIGWYFFGETMGVQKMAAIALISAGVVLLAAA
jgi:phospholipid/cholesterol/gamma-HCH transport system permease protein